MINLPRCPSCDAPLAVNHCRHDRRFGRAECVACPWRGMWFLFRFLTRWPSA